MKYQITNDKYQIPARNEFHSGGNNKFQISNVRSLGFNNLDFMVRSCSPQVCNLDFGICNLSGASIWLSKK